MTSIHLTDQQRDQFATTGLIVIDGEPDLDVHMWPRPLFAPEGWRILTEPCDTCGGDEEIADPEYGYGNSGFMIACPNPDCVGGRRVVTLTATCPTCAGRGVKPYELLTLPERWEWATCGRSVGHPPLLRCCDDCEATPGVVTLGRFTIPALLPVRTGFLADVARGIVVVNETDGWAMTIVGARVHKLDPLPHPGQFVAKPQPVEVGRAANV